MGNFKIRDVTTGGFGFGARDVAGGFFEVVGTVEVRLVEVLESASFLLETVLEAVVGGGGVVSNPGTVIGAAGEVGG